MQEGKPIYVESLLSDNDYAEMSKKYPQSYTKGGKKIAVFECDFKWRYKMGNTLSPEEVKAINRGIEEIRKLLKQKV